MTALDESPKYLQFILRGTWMSEPNFSPSSSLVSFSPAASVSPGLFLVSWSWADPCTDVTTPRSWYAGWSCCLGLQAEGQMDKEGRSIERVNVACLLIFFIFLCHLFWSVKPEVPQMVFVQDRNNNSRQSLLLYFTLLLKASCHKLSHYNIIYRHISCIYMEPFFSLIRKIWAQSE